MPSSDLIVSSCSAPGVASSSSRRDPPPMPLRSFRRPGLHRVGPHQRSGRRGERNTGHRRPARSRRGVDAAWPATSQRHHGRDVPGRHDRRVLPRHMPRGLSRWMSCSRPWSARAGAAVPRCTGVRHAMGLCDGGRYRGCTVSQLGPRARSRRGGTADRVRIAFVLASGLSWVGLRGLEPLTSSLSGKRSNRLSYRPRCDLAAASCWAAWPSRRERLPHGRVRAQTGRNLPSRRGTGRAAGQCSSSASVTSMPPSRAAARL